MHDGVAVLHSALPESLTAALDEQVQAAEVQHVARGNVGRYRSADVAEAVDATAPVGLPLLAPVATWAGVTRDDEPGCDGPAQHDGTILRLVARDSEVTARVATDRRLASQRAYIVVGEHYYGR